MKKEVEINKLIQAIVNGDTQRSVELSEKFLSSGLPVERLFTRTYGGSSLIRFKMHE